MYISIWSLSVDKPAIKSTVLWKNFYLFIPLPRGRVFWHWNRLLPCNTYVRHFLNWKALNNNSTAHTLLQPKIIYCGAQIGKKVFTKPLKMPYSVTYTLQTTRKTCALNSHTVLINPTNYPSFTETKYLITTLKVSRH